MKRSGSKLKAGDEIEVWWSSTTRKPNRDIIERIEAPSELSKRVHGPLFPQGYAFAYFVSGISMTIDFSEEYEVFVPGVDRAKYPSKDSMRNFGSNRGL